MAPSPSPSLRLAFQTEAETLVRRDGASNQTKAFQTKTLSARLGWKHVQATWILKGGKWVIVGAMAPFSTWFGNSPESAEQELKRRKIPFKWISREQLLS